VAKMEVAHWPVVGFLGRLTGTIFINREIKTDVVRVGAIIQESLNRGDGVVFFPEGTSSEGKSVGRFKSSLLHNFAVTSFPVHYAAISYSSRFADASQEICWWGDMTFLSHFWNVLKIPSFEAKVRFGAQPIVLCDRKALTEALRSRIETLFIPTSSPSAA
jgi:1-acyl-sn-glycerol-3-phosphate acyltransferase